MKIKNSIIITDSDSEIGLTITEQDDFAGNVVFTRANLPNDLMFALDRATGHSTNTNTPASDCCPHDTAKFANAREQCQAQFDSIVEMVEALNAAQNEEGREHDDMREKVEQAIYDDALTVEVRSAWYSPGPSDADTKPAEYRILLCTGGPACQIAGTLSEHGEPETARMEVQDWFTPWTEFRPRQDDAEEILLTYARCFCFLT